MTMIRISSLPFLAALALPASAGGAQTALVPVVVTATRDDHSGFDLPMAIDTVEGSTIQAQLRAGISEILNRIPGVSVQNRETFSQQQITLRGFGARSQFGVRGVRLLADGIPASAPDGQANPAARAFRTRRYLRNAQIGVVRSSPKSPGITPAAASAPRWRGEPAPRCMWTTATPRGLPARSWPTCAPAWSSASVRGSSASSCASTTRPTANTWVRSM